MEESTGAGNASASTSASADESGSASEGEKSDANDYSRFDDVEDSDEDEIVADKDSLTVAERYVARERHPHPHFRRLTRPRGKCRADWPRVARRSSICTAPHPTPTDSLTQQCSGKPRHN